jgi:GT2 family glycosyltransferase
LNCGVVATTAPNILLLNPDIEFVDGHLETLTRHLADHPRLGLIGVHQVGPDGELQHTIRRFPSVLRTFGESLGSESWPVHPRLFGERNLSTSDYERPVVCDWMSGSLMLVRRSALVEVGGFDEGYFLYCEEPDVCLRLRRAGWFVEYRPEVTIVHHGGNEASDSQHAAQLAYARRLYMERHFSQSRRVAGTLAQALGYALRIAFGGLGTGAPGGQRANARAALATTLGLREAPFRPMPEPAASAPGHASTLR